jgi:hypothetical protein
MKIDTTQIPNFDTLPEEAKSAILSMEFADAPDMSQFVAKSVFDKKASEAADLGKKLREHMTDEEAKAAKAAEEYAALIERAEKAENALAVSNYVTAYMAMGYDDKLAQSTAEAMVKGDTATVLKNQKIHLDNREKALKAELLKQTPPPAGGGSDTAMTKEKLRAMSPQERYEFSQKNPEEYKNIYGGN